MRRVELDARRALRRGPLEPRPPPREREARDQAERRLAEQKERKRKPIARCTHPHRRQAGALACRSPPAPFGWINYRRGSRGCRRAAGTGRR